jgi:glutaredoxin-like protein NrdH
MMTITLWTKSNCVQCTQTAKEFDKRGIIYKTRRLDKSPKAIQRFLDLGFMSAPIIETDDRRWSGFRLDKIKSLEYHLKSERAHGQNVPLQPLKQIADEITEDGE